MLTAGQLVYLRHLILVSKESLIDTLSNGTLVIASSYFVLKFWYHMVHHFLFMCALGMHIIYMYHMYNTKFIFSGKTYGLPVVLA